MTAREGGRVRKSVCVLGWGGGGGEGGEERKTRGRKTRHLERHTGGY